LRIRLLLAHEVDWSQSAIYTDEISSGHTASGCRILSVIWTASSMAPASWRPSLLTLVV